ncbi:hypothetical protein XTPLMG728_2057 [Xanthomonas translucens pv. poae]|uniref:Relaxation protein n=1 Tax=Xanthomonas graminis pv. poae TaxID=227946 RepID=A0A0K2ZXG5_9XANT|nr:hypothetical protein [Xanthomonas translucens]CTP88884.1 hypothetical protein XTPLMG728_2057 [Xanthomonas translucens pv. poae]
MDTQNTPALTESNTSTAAQQEACKALATLAATLQRQVQRLQDQVAQQLQALNAAADNADHKVNRVVENALPRLTQQALSATLEPAAERHKQKLADTHQALHHTTQRYAQAQHALEAAAMRRMWMMAIAMLLASAMGVGGAGCALYSAKAAVADLQQRRAQIDYLDRIARADLAPCGTDRLCAEVEKAGPHYGDHGQYRLIALRRSTPR